MAKKPSKTKKNSRPSVEMSTKKRDLDREHPIRREKKEGRSVDKSPTENWSSKTNLKGRSKRNVFRGAITKVPPLVKSIQKWGSERANKAGSPHKSFRRTYREDYQREANVPGVMHHIFASFRTIFTNYKLFLPFLLIMVILSIVLIGLMGESSYTELKDAVERSGGDDVSSITKAWTMFLYTFSTGGLAGTSKEVTMVFSALIFLTIWLVTIFIIRHKMAKHEIKLRDALYNAMTPLLSTLVILAIVIIECIPLFLLIIVYSAAIQTEFLTTPFYTLLFVGFAVLMIMLSGYLLSSSIVALLAASAPGLYPMMALDASSELMMGRRIRFVMRLTALMLTVIVMWVIVMMPLILFDMFMKQFAWTSEIPFIPICLVTMTCFTEIYVTTYLYKYYRYLLDGDS